jgi:hypothetical protein
MKLSTIALGSGGRRENFKPVTQRPVMGPILSLGKCIANIIQWHIIELLKVVLMPLRVGNFYLMKAKVLDELFQTLDKNAIGQYKKNTV